MKTLTKTEIGWVSKELEEKAKQLRVLSTMEATTGTESAFYTLRAEQLDDIAKKLREAVESGDKRIEVKY